MTPLSWRGYAAMGFVALMCGLLDPWLWVTGR